MKQMPVPTVELLSVDDFLMRFDDADVDKKAQLVQMFKVATDTIKGICNTMPLVPEPPQIRIRIAEGLQAEGNSFAIYINEELVNYYLDLTEPPAPEIIPELNHPQHNFRDPFFFRTMAFMWMVLHELFHSLREHNEVAKSVGYSKDTWFAIEMDADLLATARVYRYAQHRYQTFMPDLVIKKLAFTFVYWGFRGLPGPKGDDSHPSSIDRLGLMMRKVVMLRRVNTDSPDRDSECEVSHAALEPLLECFINCERAFSSYKGIEPDFTSMSESLMGKARPISVRWNEIRGKVSDLSGTKA